MKAALALVSMTLLAFDAWAADFGKLDIPPVRPAQPGVPTHWTVQDCIAAVCEVAISVTPPATPSSGPTGDDCGFNGPDVVRVHKVLGTPYAATTKVKWILTSANVGKQVRFGWTAPLRSGLRVRDSILADDDPDELLPISSASFKSFVPKPLSVTEGTTDVVTASLQNRIYFYRAYVEWSSTGVNWSRCKKHGPMIVNNG